MMEYECDRCHNTQPTVLRLIQIRLSNQPKSFIEETAELFQKPLTYEVCGGCFWDFEILLNNWRLNKNIKQK